jgi:hypothetical protein
MTQLQPDIFVNNRPDTDGDEEEDYFDYFYDEPGSEPGTLIIEPDAKPSRIILIDYGYYSQCLRPLYWHKYRVLDGYSRVR